MGIFTVVLMIDAPLNTIRKERRIKQQDYSRGLVRFIMSKNDILQNDQLEQETQRLEANIDESVNLTKKQIKKQYWMFTFPGLIINICRIITYLYGAYLYFRQMISISTLTTYIGFLFMIDKIVTSTIE